MIELPVWLIAAAWLYAGVIIYLAQWHGVVRACKSNETPGAGRLFLFLITIIAWPLFPLLVIINGGKETS